MGPSFDDPWDTPGDMYNATRRKWGRSGPPSKRKRLIAKSRREGGRRQNASGLDAGDYGDGYGSSYDNYGYGYDYDYDSYNDYYYDEFYGAHSSSLPTCLRKTARRWRREREGGVGGGGRGDGGN